MIGTYIEEVLAVERPCIVAELGQVLNKSRVLHDLLEDGLRRQLVEVGDIHHLDLFVLEDLHIHE